jgi:hypothetical protein
VKGRFLAPSFYLLPFTLLLALALRLLLWSAPLHLPANDEVEYIAVARDLLAGRGWVFYEHYHWLRAPLYPLWLAGSLWLAGRDPLLSQAELLHRAALPNIALSVLNVYLIYRLALALVGRRAAQLAGLLAAALWTFATFASLYMAETLFTTMFTAGLLCLVRRPTLQRLSGGAGGERRPALQSLPRWVWSAAAGVLFGLATLTRSITLLFLPVVALWLLAQEPSTKNQELRTERREASWFSVLGTRFWPALTFLLAAALTIAPWTIRNYRAYGRVILVETGLSYNLWAFNEPRERDSEIFRTLEQIPNPAERSDYATAKGLARLREDPGILLRKLWPNWVYLTRVKPIEDRFLQENYYSDVNLPLFAAALLFDDGLYLAIALAGIAGLVLCRRARTMNQEPRTENRRQSGSRFSVLGSRLAEPRWLMVLWLLYAIGTMLLTHGEARYRHFLFPVLIAYAAAFVVDWKPNLQSAIYNLQSSNRFARLWLVILMWALVGGTWLAYYPWGWAAANLARGWHAAAAELAWARGDQAGALAADERALAAQETPDGWLRLGNHARAAGDPRRALNAYNAARTLSRSYVPEVATLGDFLRATGDTAKARSVFRTDDVDQQQLLGWAWRELRPAPRVVLTVGDGLDIGYVTGVHPAEQVGAIQARWTDGRAMFRFGGADRLPGPARAVVRLKLAAPWPAGDPAAQVCAGEQCWPLRLSPDWRTYTVAFDLQAGAPPAIELRSGTFQAGDGRRLGVLVSEVALISAPAP